MNTFLMILEILQEFRIKAWSWIRKSQRNKIITIIGFMAFIIGAVLFTIYVLPTLFLFVALVLLYKYHQSESDITGYHNYTFKNPFICYAVTEFVFKVITIIAEVFREFIVMPNSPHDMYDPQNYITYYKGVPLLCIRLRRNQKPMTESDCEFLKGVLQEAINARLSDGYLQGHDWSLSVMPQVPLIKVVAVEFNETHIFVYILLTNTAESANAAIFSDREKNNENTPDDFDPLF